MLVRLYNINFIKQLTLRIYIFSVEQKCAIIKCFRINLTYLQTVCVLFSTHIY